MIRVGVIGFGFAGRIFHAPVVNAVEGLELAAILQRSGRDAAEAYPAINVPRSVEELLSDSSIRLVVIATPNSSHFPIARQCLLAGRDVVIDKPFALNSAEAVELIRLARTHGRLLTVYHNRRWDGDFRTVLGLLGSGQLGRLVMYESHFDRFRPIPDTGAWRQSGAPGGGVLLDLGSHLIDQALVAFGLPKTVWADVRVERAGGMIDDAFDLCLRYPGSAAFDIREAAPGQQSGAGLTVWLRATSIAREPGPRFTLNGTRGTFCKFGIDPQEDRLRAGDLFRSSPWGADPEVHWGTLTEEVDGLPLSRRIPTEPGDYRCYYENVRDALLGAAPLEVTPVQAWRTMRILEMALESSRARREIVCDWSDEP
ncbi:MAG TPA: Gfo/Idh/MocA family oxidoreductase [Acidobacteriaceae bacterium]|nr:Gfo/Idh/MocA family oxidoreductase [Acidobacteriaceae bacterium]